MYKAQLNVRECWRERCNNEMLGASMSVSSLLFEIHQALIFVPICTVHAESRLD